jgi:hypothetical protein
MWRNKYQKPVIDDEYQYEVMFESGAILLGRKQPGVRGLRPLKVDMLRRVNLFRHIIFSGKEAHPRDPVLQGNLSNKMDGLDFV